MKKTNIGMVPLLAFVLTLFQVILGWYLTQESDFRNAYHRLCQWDSGWYSSIAQNGYITTVPLVNQVPELANVCYFPGYPISARLLHLGSGLDVKTSLLFVSQIACFVFWIFFLLILR